MRSRSAVADAPGGTAGRGGRRRGRVRGRPLELGREARAGRRRRARRRALVGEDGRAGARGATVRSRSSPPVDRPDSWLEVPLLARADDRRAEADRGDVTLADAAQADREASLPGAKPALVGMQHRARIAQRRPLDGVLGGESSHPAPACGHGSARCRRQKGARRRGRRRSSMAREQCLVVVVAGGEVRRPGRLRGPRSRRSRGASLGRRSDRPGTGRGAAPRRAGTAAR